MKRARIAALILGFSGLLSGERAAAFVSVSPATVEIFGPAGKKVSGDFTVRNPLDRGVEVAIAVERYGGSVGMADIPHGSWLTLSRTKPFTLQPGGARDIGYKVKIPKDLSGEIMVMVYFKIQMAEAGLGGAVVERRHGTPIYVVAKDTERIEVELKDLFAKFGSTAPAAPVEFTVQVQNLGNVHLRPKGIVQIYKGGELLEESRLESGFPVYPTARHPYSARSAATDWAPGLYEAKFVVYFGGEYGKQSQAEKALKFNIGENRKIDFIN